MLIDLAYECFLCLSNSEVHLKEFIKKFIYLINLLASVPYFNGNLKKGEEMNLEGIFVNVINLCHLALMIKLLQCSNILGI